jgi:hypothetical protein
VKSRPPVLHHRVEECRRGLSPRQVLFRLVGPPLQPVEVGLFLGTRCMVLQSYAGRGNRSYLGVLGCNRWPTVPGVNYPDSSPRFLRFAGGRSRSLDGGCNRFSYGTVGTTVGLNGEIYGAKASTSSTQNPTVVPTV